MHRDYVPKRRRVLQGIAAATAAVVMPRSARAAEPLKIGLILPQTGQVGR